MNRTSGQKGFTLVELAISLTVIGLLIGGILKGRELVDNATATRVVRQVQAYKAAAIGFKDSYGTYPGDIPDPNVRLPNCTTGNCIIAGNNDGIVGTEITGNFTSTAIAFPPTQENRRFWLHLAVTKMLSGLDESGTDIAGPCGSTCGDFGYTYPAGVDGGGYYIAAQNAAAVGGYPATKGHYLWLTANPGQLLGYVLPHIAGMIDRKADDGRPFTGEILSTGGTCVNGTNYNDPGMDRNCGLDIFLVD